MGKHNVVSGILVLVVILMIAISSFLVITYATGVVTAAVSFASSDQVAKLRVCGIDTPNELLKLRADIPGLLLPVIYVGLPGLMILIAIMMFIAGYYYGSGKETHSSSTTTTMSSPNRSRSSGRYKPGRHIEKTRTRRSSTSEGN